MDLFTTALSLAGAKPPSNKFIDGIDLSSALFYQNITVRYTFQQQQSLFCSSINILAVRLTSRQLVPGIPASQDPTEKKF